MNDERRPPVTFSRDESWRFQYRLRPYLDNASVEELELRFDDVVRNIYTLTPEGKVGALHPDQGGHMWAQKMMDLGLECYRRNGDIADLGGIYAFPVRQEMLPIVKANRHLVPHARTSGVFCKYGEEQWMKALLDSGSLRISPASYYRDREHNVARQDDELVLRTHVTPYDYDLGLIGSLRKQLPKRCWAVMNNRKPTDHYIYCVTVKFDFRCFFDFVADSCVIIKNQDEFVRRLVAAVRRMLPEWQLRLDGVRYMDPYFMLHHLANAGDDIYLFKDFRYMYQFEHRLVATPPRNFRGELEHLEVSLGSLRDIAEFVKINQ